MKRNKKGFSSTLIIAIYLVVSVIGIIVLSNVYGKLISNHDNTLTVDIDNLIAEKMNRSIEYMQQSVDEMATVLSYQDLLELDQLYDQLTGSIEESDYISIGIVDIDGKVYGTPSEQEELEKWGLIEMAANTKRISTSEPYRAAMTGKLVFTMFSPIFQQGERLGCIFVTYPLSEIQDIAKSAVLEDEVEIYLMNSLSDNLILCSGSDEYKIGNWNSTKLMKRSISKDSIADYEKWENQIRMGVPSDSVTFKMDDENYTQVYQQIEAMAGWSLVCRIPNSTLSNTMQQFRKTTIVFVSILIVMSLCLVLILRKRDKNEKEKFEYMSTHDALTDVYNRNAFDMVVQKYLDNEGKTDRGALAFLDLDYFKQINDRYGHDSGDKALIAFSDFLKQEFGEDSIIARYGGDEFVLLVKHINTNEALNERFERLRQTLASSKILEKADKDFVLHYSAGIAAFPEHGVKFADLIKCADLALYQVKEKGRDGYEWYKK